MNDVQTDAANTFVDGVRSRADDHRWGAPLWHQWALRDAFAAGCHWQAQQSAHPTPAQIAASPEVRALVEAAENAIVAMQEAKGVIVAKREWALVDGAVKDLRAALAAFKAMEAGG